jgi:hypothetical protein
VLAAAGDLVVLSGRLGIHEESQAIVAGPRTSVPRIDEAPSLAPWMIRKNQAATVPPFGQAVVAMDLNLRDSMMTNAGGLAGINGWNEATGSRVLIVQQWSTSPALQPLGSRRLEHRFSANIVREVGAGQKLTYRLCSWRADR